MKKITGILVLVCMFSAALMVSAEKESKAEENLVLTFQKEQPTFTPKGIEMFGNCLDGMADKVSGKELIRLCAFAVAKKSNGQDGFILPSGTKYYITNRTPAAIAFVPLTGSHKGEELISFL